MSARPSKTAFVFESPDLFAVGWLANRERERQHGARTYLQLQQCVSRRRTSASRAVSSARLRGSSLVMLARIRTRSKMWGEVAGTFASAVDRSAHGERPASGSAVLALHRPAPGFKRIRPGIHLKCFTAVEIAFFAISTARRTSRCCRNCATRASIHCRGGGAEVFAARAQEARSRQVRCGPLPRSIAPRTRWHARM